MIIDKIRILVAMIFTWVKYFAYCFPIGFLVIFYHVDWSVSRLVQHPELFGSVFPTCFICSFIFMLQSFGAEYNPSSNRNPNDGQINPSTGLPMHGGVDSSGTPFGGIPPH